MSEYIDLTGASSVRDKIASFKAAHIDADNESPQYYGLINHLGHWIIIKSTKTSGVRDFQYTSGKDNYLTNFTNRASLTYQLWSEVV